MLTKTLVALGMLASSQAGPSQYLHLTCNGHLHMLPGNAMGGSVDLSRPYSSMVLSAIDNLKSSYMVKCPGLSSTEVQDAFNPINFANYLRQISDPDWAKNLMAKVDDKCTLPEGTARLMPLPPVLNFPSSCSYADYQAGKPCAMQFSVPDKSMEMVVQLEKCSGSFLPSLIVGCAGDGCANFMTPCSTDADCKDQQTCTKMGEVEDWGPLNDAMDKLFLFSSTFDTGCEKDGMGFAERMLTEFTKRVLPSFGLGSFPASLKSVGNMGFCDLPETVKKIMPDFTKLYAVAEDGGAMATTDGGAMATTDGGAMATTDAVTTEAAAEVSSNMQGAMDEFDVSILPCVMTADDKLDCAGLKALSTPLVSQAKPLGEYVTAADGVVLLRWDCEGHVQMGDSSTIGQMRMRSETMPKMLEAVVGAMEEVLPCRDAIGAGGIGDTLQKYFLPYGMRFWATLGFTDLATDTLLHSITPAHKLAEMMGVVSNTDFDNLPAGCNKATLLAGQCDVSVDLSGLVKGLKAPWSDRTEIRAQMKTCGKEAGYMIEGMVSCVGGACGLLKNGVTGATCSATVKCASGYICANPMGGEEPLLSNAIRRVANIATSDSPWLCMADLTMETEFDTTEWIKTLYKTDPVTKKISFGSAVSSNANANQPLPVVKTDTASTKYDNKLGSPGGMEEDASGATAGAYAHPLLLLAAAGAYALA